MIPIKLTPYNKAVLTAIGGLVTTVISFLVGDGADPATLGAAIMTVLTTFGVYKVTNAPLPEKGTALMASPHTSVSMPVEAVPMTVQNVVPIKPKPRVKPRPTSKPVKPARKRATAKKTPKEGE